MLTGTIHHPTARERGREDKERKKKEGGVTGIRNTLRKENDQMIENENNRETIGERISKGKYEDSCFCFLFLFCFFAVVAEWRKRQR